MLSLQCCITSPLLSSAPHILSLYFSSSSISLFRRKAACMFATDIASRYDPHPPSSLSYPIVSCSAQSMSLTSLQLHFLPPFTPFLSFPSLAQRTRLPRHRLGGAGGCTRRHEHVHTQSGPHSEVLRPPPSVRQPPILLSLLSTITLKSFYLFFFCGTMGCVDLL
jgi:hypothetical protein